MERNLNNINEAYEVIEGLVGIIESMISEKDNNAYQEFVKTKASEKGIDLEKASPDEKAAFFKDIEKQWKSKEELKNESVILSPFGYGNLGRLNDVTYPKPYESKNPERVISLELIYELLMKGKTADDIARMSNSELESFLSKTKSTELKEYVTKEVSVPEETIKSDLFKSLVKKKHGEQTKINTLSMVQLQELISEYDSYKKLGESYNITKIASLVESVIKMAKEDMTPIQETVEEIKLKPKKTYTANIDKFEYKQLLTMHESNKTDEKYITALNIVTKKHNVDDIMSLDEAMQYYALREVKFSFITE